MVMDNFSNHKTQAFEQFSQRVRYKSSCFSGNHVTQPRHSFFCIYSIKAILFLIFVEMNFI